MQHKDSWELQLEFLKEYEDKYDGLILDLKLEIGRASCRERVSSTV